jgi:heat shock protein HslJ
MQRRFGILIALLVAVLLAGCTMVVAPEASPPAEDGPLGTTWAWQQSEYADGTTVAPADPSLYTITLNSDGSVAAQLDCNRGVGGYTLEGDSLTFGPMAMTAMACPPGSLDSVFGQDLAGIASFTLEGDALTLAGETVTMTFAPLAAAEEMATPAPEEEADAANPLADTTWQWVETVYGDDTSVTAVDPARYTLTFLPDGELVAQVDCNRGMGAYTLEGSSLTFGPLATTMMACPPDTQDGVFLTDLAEVNSFVLEGDTLSLVMKLDTGIMTFARGAAPEEETAMADPLVDTTWQWVETLYGDDTSVTAVDPARYTLTFLPDGQLSAQVDCNRGMGSYTIDGSSISFGPLATTRMACPPDTQDSVFLKDLAEVNSFVLEGDTLSLAMKLDTGIMTFVRAE